MNKKLEIQDPASKDNLSERCFDVNRMDAVGNESVYERYVASCNNEGINCAVAKLRTASEGSSVIWKEQKGMR